MRKLLTTARLAMRESSDLGKILTLSEDERALVVYAEDSFSHIQLKGYLEALWFDHHIPYQYVTSDPGDPLLDDPPPGARTWFIREQLARLLRALRCRAFLTTMPDLGKFHVPRPEAGKTVYAFHSLNSTHTAYRDGAFDNYDQFLCTGPHHVRELAQLRGDTQPELSEVGYYKLDLIRREHTEWRTARDRETDLVVLAPSWGRENLLEAHGSAIISSLLSSSFRVIVRPHPQFFHSLYRKGAEVIRALQDQFEDHDAVEFELDINTQDSFHRSALMISDWSGAAYEYSLGTYRPVLFIDTPQKIFNPSWQEVGLPAFEEVMRTDIGNVLATAQIDQVGGLAHELISGDMISEQELADVAKSVVFNLDQSNHVGAETIARSLS